MKSLNIHKYMYLPITNFSIKKEKKIIPTTSSDTFTDIKRQ